MGQFFCNDDADYVALYNQWKTNPDLLPEGLDKWAPFEYYDPESLFEEVESAIESLIQFTGAIV
jgi:hypothetical protein